MDFLKYSVALPALPEEPHDIAHRRLKVIVNGEEKDDAPIPLEVKAFEGLTIEQDAEVTLQLRNVDDSGNQSEPSVFEFKAVDNVAPAAPGSFGVTCVGETHKVEKEATDEAEPEPGPGLDEDTAEPDFTDDDTDDGPVDSVEPKGSL